jgi:hypothetical protein
MRFKKRRKDGLFVQRTHLVTHFVWLAFRPRSHNRGVTPPPPKWAKTSRSWRPEGERSTKGAWGGRGAGKRNWRWNFCAHWAGRGPQGSQKKKGPGSSLERDT